MVSDPNQSSAPAKGRKLWLLALVIIAIVVSSITSVDQYAKEDLDNLFRRALVTFALARTLNGLISVVQGTEVAVQPAGIGVTLTPGEILDPVNDLVERFSWIMLAATISLGVQQVLLDIGQWWVLRVLVVLSGLMWLWWMIRSSPGGRNPRVKTETILMRVFLVVLFLRFAVPLTLVANEALYVLFLQSRYDESAQVIQVAGKALQEADADAHPDEATAEEDEPGFMGSLNRAMESTAETLNFNRRLAHMKERAAELIEHLIQLSVVFILQTGILPLVFLWALMRVLSFLVLIRAEGGKLLE